MRTKFSAMTMLVFCCAVTIQADARAGWLVGSGLTVSVDDSPTGANISQPITLAPGLTVLGGGEMTVTQSIIPVSATSQWVTFDFESSTGGPLAGNLGGYWQVQLSGIQTSSPAYVTSLIGYWTNNEVATSPINPWSGFTTVETNPINPLLGPVYIFSIAPSGPGYTSSSWYFFATPYSAISEGGMNPATVNGFTMGLLEVDAVPEPSSLCLFASGAGILGIIGLARRKRSEASRR